MELLKVHPKKQSRPVTPEDIPGLLKIQREWKDLCNAPVGRYPKAHALAHVQVEAKDPMRVFITAFGELILNPELVEVDNKSKGFHKEGCMSWPFREIKKVRRYGRIKVKYQSILLGEKKPADEEKWFEDLHAFVFQHELDHFNLNTLY